jgi:hypothetical protein
LGNIPRKKWVSVAIVIASIVGVLVLVVAGGAAVLLWRYVQTDYADAQTADREFERVRALLAGREPLIEDRGGRAPVVRRNASAPRRELHGLHVLAFDGHGATEGQLRRANVPAGVIRLITLGGRIRLMGVGMLGDQGDRITLEDLERHGAGLILDFRGGAWQFAMSDAIVGTNAQQSRLLVWTD